MKKQSIILIVVAAVAVVAFFLLRKKGAFGNSDTEKTEDEIMEEMLRRSEGLSASAIATTNKGIVNSVELEPDQEEYNEARQDYKNLLGKYPPSTWTLSMIKSEIGRVNERKGYIEELGMYTTNAEYNKIKEKADPGVMSTDEVMRLVEEYKDKCKEEWQKKQPKISDALLHLHNYFKKTWKERKDEVASINAITKLSDDKAVAFQIGYILDHNTVTVNTDRRWLYRSYSNIVNNLERMLSISGANTSPNKKGFGQAAAKHATIRSWFEQHYFLVKKDNPGIHVNEYGQLTVDTE